ncbi:MAG: hypothetical protein HC898_02525 [Phycisphaerales bacterium]|nr:hypothetical protein [Phycisphaerales bacterium]
MNGQSHPGFDSVRLLIRHLSNPEAQRALLTALLTGTAWRVQFVEKQVSADGHHSDLPRTMARMLHSLRDSTTVLTLVHDRLSSNPQAREPMVHAMPVLARLLDETTRAQRVLQTVYDHDSTSTPQTTESMQPISSL